MIVDAIALLSWPLVRLSDQLFLGLRQTTVIKLWPRKQNLKIDWRRELLTLVITYSVALLPLLILIGVLMQCR